MPKPAAAAALHALLYIALWPVPADAQSMFTSSGALNTVTYELFAHSYDKATMEKRLGPGFLDLSPNATDDRPTLYRPPSIRRTSGSQRLPRRRRHADEPQQWRAPVPRVQVPVELAARGAGNSQFPEVFSVKPSIKPKVVWQTTVKEPTAVLAGHRMDRWTRDHYKAYVAIRGGTIHILNTSSLMNRWSWERLGALRIVGSFDVGRNPVSMCFTRRGDSNLPLLPVVNGSQKKPDPLNNLFYVAVRGDRKVVAAVTFEGKGAVYRTIRDKRMGDPVAVSTAVRGPIVSVADFRGKKMISFRVGKIQDRRNGEVYGCGSDGKAPFEFAGEVPFAGHPFLLNSTNVN